MWFMCQHLRICSRGSITVWGPLLPLPDFGLQEALPNELLAGSHEPGLREPQPLHVLPIRRHLHSQAGT